MHNCSYSCRMLTVMRDTGGLSEPAGPTFTGTTWKDIFMPSTDGVGVGNVFFEPCSRTHWHSHPGGQLLVIVAGEGVVATRDERVTVRAGDKVWTPPQVHHWHGATPNSFMIHLAVTLGETRWEGPVSDEEYASPGSPLQD